MLARQRRCMQEQGQVQCVRQTRRRRGGAVGFGGLEVTGGQRECVLLPGYWARAVVLVLLSQPEFGSARTFSPL